MIIRTLIAAEIVIITKTPPLILKSSLLWLISLIIENHNFIRIIVIFIIGDDYYGIFL